MRITREDAEFGKYWEDAECVEHMEVRGVRGRVWNALKCLEHLEHTGGPVVRELCRGCGARVRTREREGGRRVQQRTWSAWSAVDH